MSAAQQEALMERRRAFLGSRHGSTSWKVGEDGFPLQDNSGASQRITSFEEVAC